MLNQLKPVITLSLLLVIMLTSCETNHYGVNSWQDLSHSRDLDKLKGKRLKSLQRNTERADDY